MRTPHIGEETITELKQREIQKKVRQILQILKWGRDPAMLILCDKELHKDTRHAMVQAYIEICELLDCTPQSLLWKPETETERQAREDKEDKEALDRIIESLSKGGKNASN